MFAAGELDGKTFVGELGKYGTSKGEPDEVIFQDGTMRSTACDRDGFAAGPYRVVSEAESGIGFEATTTSPTNGQIVWVGIVREHALDASAIWSRRGRPPVEYWMRGRLKEESQSEEEIP